MLMTWRRRVLKGYFMTSQRQKLLFGAAFLCALLLALAPRTTLANDVVTASLATLSPSIIHAATMGDMRRSVSAHEIHLMASPVHEDEPCNMSSRCSSSTCMGAFPHEEANVFPAPQTDNHVLITKLMRFGSDLPPPIGPPRWIS